LKIEKRAKLAANLYLPLDQAPRFFGAFCALLNLHQKTSRSHSDFGNGFFPSKGIAVPLKFFRFTGLGSIEGEVFQDSSFC